MQIDGRQRLEATPVPARNRQSAQCCPHREKMRAISLTLGGTAACKKRAIRAQSGVATASASPTWNTGMHQPNHHRLIPAASAENASPLIAAGVAVQSAPAPRAASACQATLPRW